MSETSAGRRDTRSLRDAVARLRVRGRGPSVERWLMIAGAAMLALGLPVIVLGWWGAARTPYVFEQIPYLISGGLLGLALAVVGGLTYFAYWMTRMMRETRAQGEETRAVLARIEALLAGGAVASNGSAVAAQAEAFVATGKGTMFHRPDCAIVAGRDDVRAVSSDEPGFQPCRICQPLAVG